MHRICLTELTRILKPGGMLMVTTRRRDFIEFCAELRKRADLAAVHPATKVSAAAFLNTEESLKRYDNGEYCYSQLVFKGDWSYWGDAAISKQYVLKHWTGRLRFVEYSQSQYAQDFIIMQKPTGEV
jgi:hypothetical protein